MAMRLNQTLRGALEIVGEVQLTEGENDPFAGIPMVPADSITVVVGKLVMKIVIPLAVGQDGSKPMIARGNGAVILTAAKGVSIGINKERGVHHQNQPQTDRHDKRP